MLLEIGRKGTLFSFMLYLIYKKNVLCCNSNILCLYCLQFDMYITLRIDSVLLMMNKYSFLLHNYINKKAPRDCLLRLRCVGLPGFEPGQTEPKPVVLPLHHSPNLIAFFRNAWQRYYLFMLSSKFSLTFFVLFSYLQVYIY